MSHISECWGDQRSVTPPCEDGTEAQWTTDMFTHQFCIQSLDVPISLVAPIKLNQEGGAY